MSDTLTPGATPAANTPATEERDPVCGMRVDPTTASYRHLYAGRSFYFCAQGCLDMFKTHPERYVGASGKLPSATPVARDATWAADAAYTCPMHPEVRTSDAGPCPKCGMALERTAIPAMPTKVQYTCPMHPEIVRDEPGACPICGMALEPRGGVGLAEEENPELTDMARRFWIGAALTLPVIVLAVIDIFWRGAWTRAGVNVTASNWIQLAFSTPVVMWAGWPLFQRGWASITNRSPNMFTLIAVGVGAAYVYSAAATIVPNLFPSGFRTGGVVEPYFDTAAVITVLVLLGQVLELRARSRTSLAIKQLLGLAPKTGRVIRPDGREEDIPLAAVHV